MACVYLVSKAGSPYPRGRDERVAETWSLEAIRLRQEQRREQHDVHPSDARHCSSCTLEPSVLALSLRNRTLKGIYAALNIWGDLRSFLPHKHETFEKCTKTTRPSADMADIAKGMETKAEPIGA